MRFTRRRRGVGINPSELLGIFLDLGLVCFHNVAYAGQELAFVRTMSTVADDTSLDLLRLSVVSLKGPALPRELLNVLLTYLLTLCAGTAVCTACRYCDF